MTERLSVFRSLLRRERPFVFWLVLVQLAAVLPLLGFSSLVTYRLVTGNEREVVAQLQRQVALAAGSMSREARRVRNRHELLASQLIALSHDAIAVRALAARLVAIDRLVVAVAVLDEDGKRAFSTEQAPDQDLPLSSWLAQDAVFDSASMTIDPLVKSRVDAGFDVNFSVPITSALTPPHRLVISVRQEALGQHLREQNWPLDWTAALIDQASNIVARSKDEKSFIGQPASPSLRQFIQKSGAGTTIAVTKDGTEVVTAVAVVMGTPWRLVAGIPRADLQRRASAPLRELLIGGSVLIGFGVCLSILLARRLNRSVRAVTEGRSTVRSEVSEFRAVEVQRLMLENDLIGMVRFKDRKSVWHNRALERIFGYDAGELDGHSPRLMHVDDVSFLEFGRVAYSVLETGQGYRTELEMVRKDRSRVWVDVSGVKLASGETMWMIVDVSAQKMEQARISKMAFRDELTELPNRKLFMDRLVQALTTRARSGAGLAVCFIDLNGFKAINDVHGHAAGDLLLKMVASRIEACIRPHDTVARLGGDEFLVLLDRLSSKEEIEQVLQRIRQAVSLPVLIAQGECAVTAAIGVAFAPEDGIDAADLIATADSRMYRDKSQKLR